MGEIFTQLKKIPKYRRKEKQEHRNLKYGFLNDLF